MSAIANIVAYDGAASPVAHTLTPVSVTRTNGVIVALWRELLSSVPTEAQITHEERQERVKSGVFEITTTTIVPVMESVSGQNSAGYTAAPKVAYVDKRKTIQYAHPRSTEASRRLTRQLDINIQGSIATSVTPVTTGPAPEAFDKLIMPT